MGQVNWFDRKFNFTSDENIMPSVIERLQGTTLRMKDKLDNVDLAILQHRPNGKWSILEHVGHLSDLEPLWQGRLDDILNGAEFLRATDLTNRATSDANHNAMSLNDLIAKFSVVRSKTLTLLTALDEANIFKYALHPRLKTPMRTIDLFIFVAEHDDHHLAKMTEILKSINPAS